MNYFTISIFLLPERIKFKHRSKKISVFGKISIFNIDILEQNYR